MAEDKQAKTSDDLKAVYAGLAQFSYALSRRDKATALKALEGARNSLNRVYTDVKQRIG